MLMFSKRKWLAVFVIIFVGFMLGLGFGMVNRHRSETLLPSCEENRDLKLTTPYMEGYDIFELQLILTDLSVYTGPKDGIYDPSVEKAVKEIQRQKGIDITGIVDDETWYALGERYITHTTSTPPPPTGEKFIFVDVNSRTLTLFSDGEPYKTYPVSVGAPSTKSPIGEWKITNKSTNWGGGFGTRWLGFNVPWGIYGIHGTNKPYSIGRAMSHGCLRMFNKDVEELYEWTPVGTRVTIVGDLPNVDIRAEYSGGSTGKDVVTLQYRIREIGFDPGFADGRFGEDTASAVKELQNFYNLPTTGNVGVNELWILGLK